MSLEYPCIYYRGNGLCSYGGDLTDANICVFGPCDHETPSRADRIRRMSDEELAELLERETYDSLEHRARWWLDWLCEPAKDGDE